MGTRTDPVKRFWKKVEKGAPRACWPWIAGTNGKGYGTFRPGGLAPQMTAHRFAYELHHGGIPDGLQVLHSCDNRRCVNRRHLFLGTNLVNMQDRDRKGRGVKPPVMKGEAHPRSKLSRRLVSAIRNDSRPQRQIAESHGISQSQVSAIRRGAAWQVVRS